MKTFKGRPVVPGTAEATALVSHGGFNTIASFYEISKIAACLMIPYLLWVTFAGYLNFAIYLMN